MIEVKNLTKKYGKFKAVDDISLTVNDGEITILLGPNGAGKSTTIKSITNLLQYEGDISIHGYPNESIDAKKSFGYIPEAPVLYDLMSIDEHIEFIGKAYRCKNYKSLAEEYLQLFHLEDKRKKAVRELSKGMKQKVSMLLALIISPKELMVDEPMVGLDPASIEETLQLFVRLKQEGVAILISTHIIDVIDEIWDQAYIMDHGRIVASVRKDELKEKSLKDIFFETVEGDEYERVA
ncbi:ABC transporter ATP-binding protein [Erysipelotrichaceae bacterium HCN-30851]